jgi:hypothetical protein
MTSNDDEDDYDSNDDERLIDTPRRNVTAWDIRNLGPIL